MKNPNGWRVTQIIGNTIKVKTTESLAKYLNQSLTIIVEDGEKQCRSFTSPASYVAYKPGMLRNSPASIAYRQRLYPQKKATPKPSLCQRIKQWFRKHRNLKLQSKLKFVSKPLDARRTPPAGWSRRQPVPPRIRRVTRPDGV